MRVAVRVGIAALCVVLVAWYCANTYRTTRSAIHKTKLILTWVPFFGDPFYNFGKGRHAFERAGCAYTACELTSDRSRVPLQLFDAILFHGYEYYEAAFGVPSHRSQSQLYVFLSLESSSRTPIPEKRENFYNYTMTYRLDSDVPWLYFEVYDIDGRRVAPAIEPDWSSKGKIDLKAWNSTLKLIASKGKPLTWFVSNCKTNSGREQYAKKLSRRIPLDIYGACGPFKCPTNKHNACAQMVGEQYYFYLALENSLCYDYVTEKAAWAMAAGTVPVIRSGANLSRFFPPGSYLEADDDPNDLADRLTKLLHSPKEYEKLLRWRAHYRVVLRSNKIYEPGEHPLCSLCARLHGDKPLKLRTESVRQWWMKRGKDPKC